MTQSSMPPSGTEDLKAREKACINCSGPCVKALRLLRIREVV
jgi:hypothetical protein